MPTTDTLLEVASARTGYGSSPIIQGVDMAIARGEIVTLIGRNGVGKSTMMRCLIGQLRLWEGSIRFRSQDVTTLPAERRAQAGMGYIPQGREVFPRMTVEENLTVGEMISGPTSRKLKDLVFEYFPILSERRRQAAGTMSGGQQQQLAIGRALIGNPDLLLLDEPSEGIQPNIVEDISRIIVQINKDLGTTILLVEQNLDMIMSTTQRCYVMDKGRITAELAAADLTDREAVKTYLQL